MPPDLVHYSSDGLRRGRTTSPSSSPEPYRERRGSRRRRDRDSQGSVSGSRERYKHRRRNPLGPEKAWRERSRSPHERRDWRRDEEERHRPRRRHDKDEHSRSRQDHRSTPRSHSRNLKQKNDDQFPLGRRPSALPSQKDAFKGGSVTAANGSPPAEKQTPNFSRSGRLAAESNTVKSSDGQAIILKYHEPTEARKPPESEAWRMYVFKGPEIMDTLELSERSCWLFGREAAVVDYLIEHPSCSKQHAVVQFRYMEKKNEYGDTVGKVTPYLIDLESANGTSVNGEEVPARRYWELLDKDIIKFGHSTREYVLQLPP